MRVVFDTNVWVSGSLTKNGAPARLVNRAIDGEFLVYSSQELYEELADVMWRDKIKNLLSHGDRINYLKQIGYVMIINNPDESLDVIDRDPADNRVLECAVDANAQFIISGNPHLLDVDSYRGISILSPRSFLNHIDDQSEQSELF